MDMGEAADPNGTWIDSPEGTYVAPHAVSQQPLMILQQLPGTVGALAQPARPQCVREDLIKLMMIQNSQMHQVVMNSLAMSALMSFGLGLSPSSAQVTVAPWHSDGEEEAEVFHYHYVPYLGAGALLAWPVPGAAQGPAAVRYLDPVPAVKDGEVSAVPPPPPPSATGTVGVNVPPASEYYDLEEGRL